LCGHDDLSQFIEKSNPKNGKIPGNSVRKSKFCCFSPVFLGFLDQGQAEIEKKAVVVAPTDT
jgi:hypothetical protein